MLFAFQDALREAKEKVEDGKGRLLTARERLEVSLNLLLVQLIKLWFLREMYGPQVNHVTLQTTIRWILGNVHAGPDRNKTADSGAAAVKTSAHVPPIIRVSVRARACVCIHLERRRDCVSTCRVV